ncbi:hypothetical protein KUTeg_008492 [Tegillarca granosa]|uniref:Protein kinase domain-containing protein n=1 Tax=Tegillarca granosa TaxID=220873 RepID=A0ABQ9FCI7_TEGGR|nr:hypothetical protein KUTeg_008492 [Tegillarca granosa]
MKFVGFGLRWNLTRNQLSTFRIRHTGNIGNLVFNVLTDNNIPYIILPESPDVAYCSMLYQATITSEMANCSMLYPAPITSEVAYCFMLYPSQITSEVTYCSMLYPAQIILRLHIKYIDTRDYFNVRIFPLATLSAKNVLFISGNLISHGPKQHCKKHRASATNYPHFVPSLSTCHAVFTLINIILWLSTETVKFSTDMNVQLIRLSGTIKNSITTIKLGTDFKILYLIIGTKNRGCLIIGTSSNLPSKMDEVRKFLNMQARLSQVQQPCSDAAPLFLLNDGKTVALSSVQQDGKFGKCLAPRPSVGRAPSPSVGENKVYKMDPTQVLKVSRNLQPVAPENEVLDLTLSSTEKPANIPDLTILEPTVKKHKQIPAPKKTEKSEKRICSPVEIAEPYVDIRIQHKQLQRSKICQEVTGCDQYGISMRVPECDPFKEFPGALNPSEMGRYSAEQFGGEFDALESLGEGGFGKIYQGFKETEVLLLQQINHINITKLFGFIKRNGIPEIIMEYAEIKDRENVPLTIKISDDIYEPREQKQKTKSKRVKGSRKNSTSRQSSNSRYSTDSMLVSSGSLIDALRVSLDSYSSLGSPGSPGSPDTTGGPVRCRSVKNKLRQRLSCPYEKKTKEDDNMSCMIPSNSNDINGNFPNFLLLDD